MFKAIRIDHSAGSVHIAHFVVLWLLIFALSLNINDLYRPFLYLNFFGISAYIAIKWGSFPSDLRWSIGKILIIPLSYTALHWMAIQDVAFGKEVRHLWLAIAITLSIWLFGRRDHSLISDYGAKAFITMLLTYTIIELSAIVFLSTKLGTHQNPHYLAFYSALGFLAVFYFLFLTHGWRQLLLAVSLAVLGYFLLLSSSRPAWIALAMAGLVALLLAKQRLKWKVALLMGIFIGIVFLLDISSFASRITELIRNISHEERVMIWKSTWLLQLDSSIYQWWFGHGLNSYEDYITQYGRDYSYTGRVFNSPHNFILDLLFSCGLLGLILYILICVFLYRSFFKSKRQLVNAGLVNLMIVALTFHLVFIAITMPVLSSYNLYMLSIFGGIALYLFTRQAALDTP